MTRGKDTNETLKTHKSTFNSFDLPPAPAPAALGFITMGNTKASRQVIHPGTVIRDDPPYNGLRFYVYACQSADRFSRTITPLLSQSQSFQGGQGFQSDDAECTGAQDAPGLLSASSGPHCAVCPCQPGTLQSFTSEGLRAAAISGGSVGKGKPYSGSMETIQ